MQTGNPTSPRNERELEGDMFRLLAENIKDYAIFIVDLDGRVVTWSTGAQQLLGYSEDEILGERFDCFFTAEDLAKHEPQREIQSALASGRAEEERWHVRKDAGRFWCSGVLTPLRGHGGELLGFAKIMRDLTEKKMAERNRDEFVAMLGHELRNPLAPMLTAVEILRVAKRSNEEHLAAQSLQMLERQIRHITRLVDDLLEVARITMGKVDLKRAEVELQPVIRAALESTQPIMERRRHRVQVDVSDEPLWLKADSVRLEQMLTNLLNNAAKYTQPGGVISLRAAREDDFALVQVSDNGVGMDAQTLPRIFEPFVQAERSEGYSQGGLGVGLTLVRRFAELHGGSVSAFSAGLGLGSEFTLRLPLLPMQRAAAAAPSIGSSEQANAPKKLRVLVVDDNTDAAESLRMLLEMHGHEVLLAHTGPSAVREATVWKPEAVLLDIGLPGMDGYEVAQTLRKNAATRQAALIAVTGFGQPDDMERSRRAGFDRHLVKPVDPATLAQVLEELSKLKD